METISVKEYKRLKELYDEGDKNAGQMLEYKIVIFDEIFKVMEDEELLTLATCIHPENDQSLISGWIPSDMVEECQLEIELTLTGTYHQWNSKISERLYSGKYFDSVKDLKKAIREFYSDYKTNPKVYFNPNGIEYFSRIDHKDRIKYYIVESGIGINE